MPIEKVQAFKVSDGRSFLNRDEAQIAELQILLGVSSGEDCPVNNITESAVKNIVINRDKVLAILSERKPRTPKKAKKKEQVAA